MNMKKGTFFPIAAAIVLFASCSTTNNGEKETFGGKVQRVFNDTKSSMENAGHSLGDAIGFEDRVNPSEDYIRVSGYNYMPLYSVNLYKGDDCEGFRSQCRQLFTARYASAVVQSVAVPQPDWLSEPVKKDNKIVGYLQTLYCFIIARDGSDGYINAKFTYQRYKEVGGVYEPLKDKWPRWENTDVMTAKIYKKLQTK